MGGSTVLSDDEVRRYRRDGFVVPAFRLSAGLLDRLRAATHRLVEDRPELVDHSIVGTHLPGGGIHGLHTDGTFLDVATDEGLPEARGQRYVLPAGAFFEIRDGKVARVTNYYNLNDWIAQVGA